MKICTHDCTYHADDIIAACILQKIYTDIEIFRSRDEQVIKSCDIVFDVGGIYDKAALRFDHHQLSFTETYLDTPLSSAGLIFRDLGLQLCENETHHKIVYERFIKYIDMHDNGIDGGKSCFSMQIAKLQAIGKTFEESMKFAMEVLDMEILFASKLINSRQIVEEAIKTQNGPFLHLYHNISWKEVIHSIQDNTKFSFITRKVNDQYLIQSIRISEDSFQLRQSLPAKWGGLRDRNLDKASGIHGGVFVHKDCFMGIWKSRTAYNQVKYLLQQRIKE